jgi:hypothetical protein
MTGNTTVALIGLGTIIASLLISLTVFAVLTARIERGYRRYSAARAEALDAALPQQRTADASERNEPLVTA